MLTDFNTVTEMAEASREFDGRKQDYPQATDALTFAADDNEKMQMILEQSWPGAPAAFTPIELPEAGLQNVCDRLKDVPYRFLKKNPAGLQADILNHWKGEKKAVWLVRTFEDKVRAVLTTAYEPVANTTVLDILSKVVDGDGGLKYKLHRPRLSENRFFLKVIAKDNIQGPDGNGNYGTGFYASNGEIGGTAITIAPFIQRNSCSNSIVLQPDAWKQNHRNISPHYMTAAITEYAARAILLADERIEMLHAAYADQQPTLFETISRLAKVRGWSQEIQNNILAGTEGLKSRAGLVHGLSFAAHAAPVSYDVANQLEMDAGRALHGIEALFSKAKNESVMAEIRAEMRQGTPLAHDMNVVG